MSIRVLLLADTHLGFDLPLAPRVERRRRGPDFFANTRRALEPARNGEVDFVVHGGDLLYRSKVPARLVAMALEPLLEVAESGTPVLLVPGNHERSAVPFPLLAAHDHLEVFDRPRTVVLEVQGQRVAVAGFPCERNRIRSRFGDLTEATGIDRTSADLKMLCMHQTVEGARVGPADFTFRSGTDIIPGRSIPRGIAAVLSGHIHRSQVLTADLRGRPLAAPVLYPGSIERTSMAERDEPKGFMILEFDGTTLTRWHVHELPTRDLVDLEIEVSGLGANDLEDRICRVVRGLDPHAVVRIGFTGDLSDDARDATRASELRRLAPPTMTVTVRWGRRRDRKP